MTEADAALLGQYVAPRRIRAVPIGVDSGFFTPRHDATVLPHPPRLVFVGNFRHPPNRDAVFYFIRDIFPRVRQAVPNAEFNIMGANSQLLELPITSGIHLAGYVEDLRPAYLEAAAFVAPIRLGNGMRVKLLEALSMGMAVVCSPLAASGFQVQEGEHLLLGKSPEEFATATIRLLTDEALRSRLGRNARKLIEEQYDWNALGRQFLDLVEAPHGC
jgi:glycosyltransferase involved in cell wall biosynthesis